MYQRKKKILNILFNLISNVLSTNCIIIQSDVTEWQLGELVVLKTLACKAGGLRFDPQMENPKFSMNLHQQNPSWMLFG